MNTLSGREYTIAIPVLLRLRHGPDAGNLVPYEEIFHGFSLEEVVELNAAVPVLYRPTPRSTAEPTVGFRPVSP